MTAGGGCGRGCAGESGSFVDFFFGGARKGSTVSLVSLVGQNTKRGISPLPSPLSPPVPSASSASLPPPSKSFPSPTSPLFLFAPLPFSLLPSPFPSPNLPTSPRSPHLLSPPLHPISFSPLPLPSLPLLVHYNTVRYKCTIQSSQSTLHHNQSDVSSIGFKHGVDMTVPYCPVQYRTVKVDLSSGPPPEVPPQLGLSTKRMRLHNPGFQLYASKLCNTTKIHASTASCFFLLGQPLLQTFSLIMPEDVRGATTGPTRCCPRTYMSSSRTLPRRRPLTPLCPATQDLCAAPGFPYPTYCTDK